MEEIRGKYNTAISFAKVIEDAAREQIRRMCNYEFTRDSKIRIMPDVHAGKGCTIGTTMTVVDKAVPNIVGVDIGCGMYTVKLETDSLDFEKIDEAAHYIPSNKNVWDFRQERFDLQELNCYRSLKETRRLEKSLGTLGGGNHFIEIDRASDGTFYLGDSKKNCELSCTHSFQVVSVSLIIEKQLPTFSMNWKFPRFFQVSTELEKMLSAELSWESMGRLRESSVPESICCGTCSNCSTGTPSTHEITVSSLAIPSIFASSWRDAQHGCQETCQERQYPFFCFCFHRMVVWSETEILQPGFDGVVL
ncbi:MAG: RtcB family protein [Selenomonadaceae bacterium]|nr:RtcB family protein [Selenomonadaceae bacterium]